MATWGSAGSGALLGRRSECEALDRVVADVVAGASRVLVLRGDAGVGKSALLSYVAERTAGWRVATAAGVESETELPYSGLHQLCAPLLEERDRLPVPQREALATVFGLTDGPVPDRLMVGLATLSLLAEVAEQHPLLCLVDDVQWLDRASAEVLAFVGRRLLAESVALVCAARTPTGDDVLAGLPELPVRGLGENDARTLLLGHLYGPMDAAVRDQIISESHGNPLALLELPRTWSTEDLAGGFGLPDSRGIAGKVEQSYTRRLRQLPSRTQTLVLAAAAETRGDPVLLHRAAGVLGIDMAAAAPAVDAGLLHIRARVRFAHPLVRSAAYRAAGVDDRYRAHRALAEVTNAEADPDRRAWHLARAVPGPDEDVAAELERSAGRAQSRGGLAAAAAFLTRAAELTPVPATRVRRALDAAFADMQAGAFDTARILLDIAREGPLDEWQRARIDLLGAQLTFASSRGNTATALLLDAARRLEALDPGLARQTYLDAFSAAQFAARLHRGVDIAQAARAARAAPRPPYGHASTGDLLLDAFGALTEDYASAVPRCRAAVRELRADPITTKEELRRLWQGCVLALEIWDVESAYDLSDRHLRTAKEIGALSELPLALGSRTPVLVFCGDLPAADSLVEQARSVMAATGVHGAPYGALTLAAWQGREEAAIAMIEATLREAGSRGEGAGVAIGEYAHAVLCNGLGRYEEALAAARRASADPQEWVVHNWGLTELVESATRNGRTDLATEAVDRLARKARACGTDWALGLEAQARALLGAGAEGCFKEAIDRLGRTRVRAHLARAHLLYGEWLRRASRRSDARRELTVAYEMFQAMGMAGFAERTRRELLATGSTVRRRTAEPPDGLTAQEIQIARLARDGLSNQEIGAQLFISARTVEWHLHKVFGKLGISSRRQLRGTFLR